MLNIPVDKQLHFGAGLLIYLLFAANFDIAVCAVLLCAIGKELYDYLYNKFIQPIHEVSIMDILATVLGGVVGATAHYVLSFFL